MVVAFSDARYQGAAAADEPVITLRASDPAFMAAMRAYARATADYVSPAGEVTDARPTVINPINVHAELAATWRRANGYTVATT